MLQIQIPGSIHVPVMCSLGWSSVDSVISEKEGEMKGKNNEYGNLISMLTLINSTYFWSTFIKYDFNINNGSKNLKKDKRRRKSMSVFELGKWMRKWMRESWLNDEWVEDERKELAIFGVIIY